MVEIDDVWQGKLPENERIRTCLRMNVPEVKPMVQRLESEGIPVDYQENEWGIIAKFFDPDGNLCAFIDSFKFEKQVRDFSSSSIDGNK